MKNLLVIFSVSALTSIVLIIIAIFWNSGMTIPMERLNYGLVFEMFTSPRFQEFHVKAFFWLFSAASISTALTLYLIHITRSSSNDAQSAPLS